jgi:hypothetical protein
MTTTMAQEGKRLTQRPADPMVRVRLQLKRNGRVMRIALVLRNLGLLAVLAMLLITLATHSQGLFLVMLFVALATLVAGIISYSAQQVNAAMSLTLTRTRAFQQRNLGR